MASAEQLSLLYCGIGRPPTTLSSEVVIYHSIEDDRTPRSGYPRVRREFVRGIICNVEAPTRVIVGVHIPPLSAHLIKYWSDEPSGLKADHEFSPTNNPAELEGEADDVIKRALSRCSGCVARGWHLPETDISCAAFGVPVPPPPKPVDRDDFLSRIYHDQRPIPPPSPDAIVMHDAWEREQDYRVPTEGNQSVHTEFLSGTSCTVSTDRKCFTAVLAPPMNARAIKHFGFCGGSADTPEPYVSDHHYVRRDPSPDDRPAGPIKSVYATCQGCFERGWHLPETDVSCFAFGVEPPPPPKRD